MNFSLTKNKAIKLREQGFSLQEISNKLAISKSTASLWVRGVVLSNRAISRIAQRQNIGQSKAIYVKRLARESFVKICNQNASQTLKIIPPSKELAKLICALMWWCEGNKGESFVRFTSSDESLIKNFLRVFRQGFLLDERKFRCLVHIHSYHDDLKQKEYWSKITSIPLKQFHKSFQKKNSGFRKHDNYQGCVAVTYYDAKIEKELKAIYNAFTLNFI